jgi:hypothetical protein
MKVILKDGIEPISLHLFFNTFADPEMARQEVERGYEVTIPPNAALPVFAIADWQTVVWTLPHAPCLPELSALLEPQYFCPSDLPPATEDYPAPQLFRYVPFKRAIFTWDSPVTERRYFIKLCTEMEFPKVVENFLQIHQLADRLSFTVPEPVAADPTSRTFSMRALAGEQFTNVMRQTQPQPFDRVGRLLAELHQADLHPTTVWTPEQELKKFDKAMAEVKLALPHLSQSIDRASGLLSEAARQINFPNDYPIHDCVLPERSRFNQK